MEVSLLSFCPSVVGGGGWGAGPAEGRRAELQSHVGGGYCLYNNSAATFHAR